MLLIAILFLAAALYTLTMGLGLVWATTLKMLGAIFYKQSGYTVSATDNYRMWGWVVSGVIFLLVGIHYLP